MFNFQLNFNYTAAALEQNQSISFQVMFNLYATKERKYLSNQEAAYFGSTTISFISACPLKFHVLKRANEKKPCIGFYHVI